MTPESVMSVFPNAKPLARVVLIDLSGLFHKNWHATANTDVSHAFHLTLQDVRRCYKNDDLVAICCDSPRSLRKEEVPSYKADRPPTDKALIGELRRTEERLRNDGFVCWTVDGYEGDDVIAAATERAVALGHDVLICSGDKDLLALVRPGVRVLRTHNWAEGGVDEVKAKFGVEPSQLPDWLCLVGDSSDNIQGCKGVGEKRATQMLQTNGDWAGIVKANENKQFTPAISAAISGFDYNTARKLVELRRDVPICFEDIYAPRIPRDSEEDFDMSDSKQGPLTSVSLSENPAEGDEGAGAKESTSGFVSFTDGPIKPAPGELPPAITIGELVPQEPKQTRALTVSNVQFDRQLEPTDWESLKEFSLLVFKCRLYMKFETPQAIWATIIRGREIGFSAMTSLDMFHVIQGRPTLSANAIQSLAEKHPDCEYLICLESTWESSTWETKHRKHPKPVQHTYTRADAVQAGLCGPVPVPPPPPGPKVRDDRGQWDKRPAELPRKTCCTQLVRMVYPSAAGGLYADIELGETE